MSEEELGQCTFPCTDVCSRKGCPYKKEKPPPPFPYGFVLASGLAVTATATSLYPSTPPQPLPPSPAPIVSAPTGVNSASNSLAEYLNICITEGWKSLLPISSLEDIFLYIFPELDYEIPDNIQEENPLIFLYYFQEASKNCDIAFFLEISNPDKIDIFNDLMPETGGLIQSQPDYASQVVTRLLSFSGSQLLTANASTQRYIFPYFLKEFSMVIGEESGEIVFIKGNDIAVMQEPVAGSLAMAYVNEGSILRFNDAAFQAFTQTQKSAMKVFSGWVPIILPDGNAGYVSSQYAYPSHDARLIVTHTSDGWKYEFIDTVRP